METRFTNSIDSNKAVMTLYGEIDSPGWQADMFTAEMRYHNNMGRDICVYINSPGGSVFGGYSIIQAIMDYQADTHIVGLAASMAGIISLFGKKRTINDFGVAMIHLPSAPKGSDKKLMDIVTAALVGILTKNSGNTEDGIKVLMADETFFDSSEWKKMGFVDEIVTTGREVVSNLSDANVSDLYNIYNNLIISEIKKTEMKKLISHFDLKDTATEEEILGKVTDLESANTDNVSAKDTEIEALQTELENMRTSNTALSEQIANQIVDSAIESGKIEKAKKEVWLEAAKKDSKAVEDQINSIATVKNSSVQTTVIDPKTGATDKPEDNIIDFVRNSGEEMLKIQDEDPERFSELMNLYEQETSKVK